MDVVAVEIAANRACAGIRAGQGPAFLECKTYGFRAHSMFDAQLYRTKEEVETWRQHGPILHFTNWLKGAGVVHDGDLAAMEAEIAAEIEAAVDFAEAGSWEPVEELERFVTFARGEAPAEGGRSPEAVVTPRTGFAAA